MTLNQWVPGSNPGEETDNQPERPKILMFSAGSFSRRDCKRDAFNVLIPKFHLQFNPHVIKCRRNYGAKF